MSKSVNLFANVINWDAVEANLDVITEIFEGVED